jgi:DNA-binding response OmpR family regulator
VLLTADASVVGLVSRLRVERLQCVKRPFGLEELRECATRAVSRQRERIRSARSAPPAAVGARGQELPAGLRVLVVDDDPLVRRAMARTFRAHDVVLAENGRAATREIERKAPDLIVTDLRMPEMDGFAFAEEVKTRWPDLANRILFLSGTDSHIERARVEAPSAPLVRKPASGEELERRMAEVLEAAAFRSTR